MCENQSGLIQTMIITDAQRAELDEACLEILQNLDPILIELLAARRMFVKQTVKGGVISDKLWGEQLIQQHNEIQDAKDSGQEIPFDAMVITCIYKIGQFLVNLE